MNSLSDKLKSLGVKVGARDLPPPRPRDPYPIQQVVPGHFVEMPQGEVFLVEDWYPLDYRHGLTSLAVVAPLQIIAEWAREPRLAELGIGAFAFLDTETTGLAGGAGTFAFMVGVGRFEGETFHVAQFFMRDPIEEPALLAELTEFLEPCQVLVTFNGKAYDVPLLNARYVTNGEDSPLIAAAHLDLLPLARRMWRDRLPSRALGYLEDHVLGVSRTEDDVPGWVIPSLYFDYLRTGDARPLKGVFYHNAVDVISLAALLGHIAALLDAPLDRDGVHSLDMVAMGKLFESIGHFEMASQLYQQGLAGELPDEAHWDTIRRLSYVHKRHGDLLAAVDWWKQAAQNGHVYAHVELAKFYEHRVRDYRRALEWAQAAITLVRRSGVQRHTYQGSLPELEHRLARLKRKNQ
jgi:uncharacterized protein YprB with RNaseH-like and TPR domain